MSVHCYRLTLSALLLLLLGGCTDDNREPGMLQPGTWQQNIRFVNREQSSLSTFRDRWLLVNFWSVGCPPCYAEMPDLKQFHAQGQKLGWTVIGIAMPYDRPDSVLSTVQKNQLNYPVALDLDGQLNQAFGGIELLPTSFLVDPQGNIVKRFTGKVSHETLVKTINQLQQNPTRS